MLGLDPLLAFEIGDSARDFQDAVVGAGGQPLFQLTRVEREALRSQNATSNVGRGGRRYLPYALSEHAAIMAATVLNSERAIWMSIFVVRAFVRMREALAVNQQIVAKLAEIERRLEQHDTVFKILLKLSVN